MFDYILWIFRILYNTTGMSRLKDILSDQSWPAARIFSEAGVMCNWVDTTRSTVDRGDATVFSLVLRKWGAGAGCCLYCRMMYYLSSGVWHSFVMETRGHQIWTQRTYALHITYTIPWPWRCYQTMDDVTSASMAVCHLLRWYIVYLIYVLYPDDVGCWHSVASNGGIISK